jgi:integrase
MKGRRGNNEGSIHQREEDGLWVARITLPDGKRKALYAQTRAEVVKKMNDALHDLGKGVPLLDERQTVRDYLTVWYDGMKTQVRPSTYRRYGDFVKHIMPVLGRYSLAKLTPQQLQVLYNKKLAEGLSPTTVHAIHAMIHRALEDALQMGLVNRNVSEMLKPPRRGNREMMTLSVLDMQHFLEVVRDDRFYALYVMALSTGMREGELLGLRWQDVDLARRTVQVRMNVAEIARKRFALAETKTAYSRRTVALTQTAVDALAEHWQKQQHDKAQMGDQWQELGLVFPNGFGTIMIPHNITKRSFKKYLVKAGLSRDIRFHDLRHTAATLLLASGVNAKVVSELLGHSNVAITLRIYAHVLPHMQQSAVLAMDNMLGITPEVLGNLLPGLPPDNTIDA